MFCMEEHEYSELLCLGFCLKILSAQHWNDGEQIGPKMDLYSFCWNEDVIKYMRIYIRLKSVQMWQKLTQKWPFKKISSLGFSYLLCKTSGSCIALSVGYLILSKILVSPRTWHNRSNWPKNDLVCFSGYLCSVCSVFLFIFYIKLVDCNYSDVVYLTF